MIPRSAPPTDVAVIGGGIIGCAAAAMLAQRGVRVVLFEAAAPGAGASGRNLGSVQHPYDADLVPLHRETLDHYRRLAAAVPAFSFPERPAGVLLLAADGDGLRRHAEQLRGLPELEAEYVGGEALRAIEPALAGGIGAVRIETGYPVRPEGALEAYLELGRRGDVELRAGRAAHPWVERGRVRGVRLGNGERVGADAVLLAAGPWTPELVAADGWPPIHRTWGVTLTLELPDPPRHVLEEEEIGEVAPGGAFRWRVPAEERAFFSLATAAGRSALGSTFFPREPDPASVALRLLERAAHFVPSITAGRILERRLCARPQSVDGRPFIGPIPGVEGLYVSAGHGPWGISTGPASARMVVDAMLDPATHPIPQALSVSRTTGS